MDKVIDLRKGFYGDINSPESIPPPQLPHRLTVLIPENRVLRGKREFDPTYNFYGTDKKFDDFTDSIKRLHLMEISYNRLVNDLNDEYGHVIEYLNGFIKIIIEERMKLGKPFPDFKNNDQFQSLIIKK